MKRPRLPGPFQRKAMVYRAMPPSVRRWVRRAKDLQRWLEVVLARRFGLATHEDRTFFLLIALVGLIAGTLGSLIHLLIDGVQRLLWGPGTLLAAVHAAPWWLRVAVPAAGGLAVGLIVRWGLRGAAGGAGGGMASLIEAVALTGGRVPARPAVVSALAAVVTVGSGGALGREGPMIRLGATLSSWIGGRLGVAPHRLKILVGCGAAAGLAAAYNIPIGGALFAMEVILGNFALEIFGPIVASSVISTLLARAGREDLPRFAAPGFEMVSGWEIFAFAGLGALGALVSAGFVLALRMGKAGFRRLPFVPEWVKPALGMALVGALAVELPEVLGGGQETIGRLIADPGIPLTLLLALAGAKLVATALTAGSGGAGGLFTPSLFVGAAAGGAYGWLVHTLWPMTTSPYGAYAVVGMAAVAAGTSHAPISAILILFEFTGNYDLILPLMVAAITSSLLSRRLQRYSIYTAPLAKKGIDPNWRMEEAILAGLKVGDLVRADPDVLAPGDPYSRVVERFLGAHRHRLFVVGDGGRLLGAVSLHDIKHALEAPEGVLATVAHDLLVPVDRTLGREERLHRAAEVFARSDFERLPVVDEQTGRFAGVLAKRDLLAVYAQEVLGRPAMLATFVSSAGGRRDYVELPPDFAVRMAPVPPGAAGRPLADLALPQSLGVQVLEIKRKRPTGDVADRLVPKGDTRLTADDLLIVVGPTDAVQALQEGRWTPGEAGVPAAAGVP